MKKSGSKLLGFGKHAAERAFGGCLVLFSELQRPFLGCHVFGAFGLPGFPGCILPQHLLVVLDGFERLPGLLGADFGVAVERVLFGFGRGIG